MSTEKTTQKKRKMLMVSQFSTSSENYCYAQFLKKLAIENDFDVKTVDCKKNHFYFGPKSSDQLFRPFKTLSNFFSNCTLLWRFLRFKPDVLFLVKGENISYRLLKFLKTFWSFKLINFYPDSPFCCWNSNSSYNVMRSLPIYDRFAIWSRLLAKVLVMSGSRQVFYWPFICDQELFQPAVLDKDSSLELDFYSSDVCFVGTWDRKREKYLSELVSRHPELEVKIWGSGWKKKLPKGSNLTSRIKGGPLQPSGISRALSSAKIALNFLRDQNFTSHNMRTFEAASCQAFLLTERSHEQSKDLFVEDESLACFAGIEELCEKVLHYLAKDVERKRVAQAAKERCKELSDAGQLFKQLTSFDQKSV